MLVQLYVHHLLRSIQCKVSNYSLMSFLLSVWMVAYCVCIHRSPFTTRWHGRSTEWVNTLTFNTVRCTNKVTLCCQLNIGTFTGNAHVWSKLFEKLLYFVYITAYKVTQLHYVIAHSCGLCRVPYKHNIGMHRWFYFPSICAVAHSIHSVAIAMAVDIHTYMYAI